VTGEAYVFAKGILEDAGFAWAVGGAQGFAVNIVSKQSPAAGTVVVDTGAPTIVLTLRRNPGDYPELGTPESSAPYPGTEIVLTGREGQEQEEKRATTAPVAKGLFRMHRPSFAPPLAAVGAGGTTIEIVSSSSFVGDSVSWVRDNGLDLREYQVPGDTVRQLALPKLPGFVAPTYRGHRLVKAIRQQKTILLVYGRDFASGRFLVAVDTKGRTRYALDFLAYGNTPVGSPLYQRVVWAAEANGVLYVETAHATYAKDSGLRNGYVTAIDLATRKVRWRSAALVANALRFELYGSLIVTGYGFTEESDFLYLLDRRSGKLVGRASLPTAADYVVRKGDLLYVRTYDHDVVARLAPA
jgi:hypothetical protein